MHISRKVRGTTYTKLTIPKDLREGDVFLGANGELLTLVANERVEFPEGITVYNFTVEGNHNYFVIAETDELGQTCVLVHNALLKGLEWLGKGISYAGKWFKGAPKNTIPEGKLANHLFKGTGKLADTPANRQLIQNMSNGKPLGVDPHGNVWYVGVDAVGKPIYSYAQNGVVKGAGYRSMSVEEMIIRYGLK